MGWYSEIAKNIDNVAPAMRFFEKELQAAKQECRIYGNIEKLSASMPGIVELRYNQLQEIEAILEYLNIELRKIKSQHFIRYFEKYNRALTSRECDKYIDSEAEVVDYEKIINEVALLRNSWLGITKALEVKQWQLSNIIKLRVAGMEDATL